MKGETPEALPLDSARVFDPCPVCAIGLTSFAYSTRVFIPKNLNSNKPIFQGGSLYAMHPLPARLPR